MTNKRSRTLISLALFSLVLIAVFAILLINRTDTYNLYSEENVGLSEHRQGPETTVSTASRQPPKEAPAHLPTPEPVPVPDTKETEVFRLSGGTRFPPNSQGLVPRTGDSLYAEQDVAAGSGDIAPLHAAPSSPDVAHEARRPEPNRVRTAVVAPQRLPDRERFPEAEGNPVRKVTDAPVSTFSVDVDTASYAFVRSELTHGRMPRSQAVRPEELINYFDYAYPVPGDTEVPFSTSVSVIETPWNANTRLLQIGLQGYSVPLDQLPPQNLVFLIDTSGSMSAANKLPLLQQAFRLLLSSLRPEDRVAIVTYAGEAGLLLEPTRVDDRKTIVRALNSLRSGGSTAGHAGLQGAYAIAEEMNENGGDARVILATDGDFNVGLSGPDDLKRYISDQRKKGISLSVLGFGRGNYNDTLMQTLAQNGNGAAAYIDTLVEARKVLVDQVVSSIVTIAQDVKIQVEFNPATVAEYRLIGYETRALKREDFNNDKVDAGDIGAGHTVTALYEITPVGSPAVRLDDLRYGSTTPEALPAAVGEFADELAFVKLRYKLPGETKSHLITTPVTGDTAGIPEGEALFAASVAGFGQLLQGTDYLGDWSVGDAEKLAAANLGNDPHGYRAEYLSLLRLAAFAKH
ncbi:vWA domain-containing protein [Roseibium sp.]|uniref:vWA domain-containing protein n=1 Tax=Roseibium sp. TaxID=1936156 RepID=UPI003BAEAA57